ncbi:MAG TPA: hypothetical protein VID94_15995 [Acidimicrobiales bacterium]
MLIGLGHQARVGKDTVGGLLVEEHGFRRYAFADALKAFAVKCNPLIDTTSGLPSGRIHLAQAVMKAGWEETKQHFALSRLFLQNVGIAAREEFGENFWVDRVMAQVGSQQRSAVITDVRFVNEADAIRAAGGFVIKVHRPGVHALNAHVSEHALDDYDFDGHLFNDGTYDDLGFTVKGLVHDLKRR